MGRRRGAGPAGPGLKLGPWPGPRWSGRRDSNPRPSAWKADALPLSYSRGKPRLISQRTHGGGRRIRNSEGVRRQIYSLLPLAARASLQPKRKWPLARRTAMKRGAGEGTRTPNHLITNEMLYQLSYASRARPVDGGRGQSRLARGARQDRASLDASAAGRDGNRKGSLSSGLLHLRAASSRENRE